MSGTYSVQDLLKLRESPLISRPPQLPPIEEWMGAQDTTARRQPPRAKQEEALVHNETFQKRPTLPDTQRRTTTDPERIVLGPPRRSFASSTARTAGKSQEEEGRDRTSYHEKPRTGDGADSRGLDRRPNGRYGSEDPDPDNRRDHDRKSKWVGRERSEHQDLEDGQLEDSSRPGFRRDTHSRAKLSQSWFRKEGELTEDSRRDQDKQSEWGRDRGQARGYDRYRPEADPEWMDSPEPEEPYQVRTQDDFQRWKEKMKAGAAGGGQDRVEAEKTTFELPVESTQPLQKTAIQEPDDSMDKFFARFETKKPEQKAGNGKPPAKSKFASLFSPPIEQNKQVEAPASTTTERPSSAMLSGTTTNDADQAGFARILEMLQTRSNNPTPGNQEANKPRTPLYARDAPAKPEMEQKSQPSDLLSFLAGPAPAPAPESTRRPPSSNIEKISEARSPVELSSHTRQQPSINKDEVLLNLLRQASLAPKPQPPPPPHHQDMRGPPGMYGMPTELPGGRPPIISPMSDSQRGEQGRSMIDEQPAPGYSGDPSARDQGSRRATNGTKRDAAPNDPLINLIRGQHLQQPPQHLPSYPVSLQRPPGLDTLPRPSHLWPSQQSQQPPPQPPPQQQPSRQASMPPGLSSVARGLIGGPYGQPPQLPNQQGMPLQQQQPRHLPQTRKYTGDSSMAPTGIPNFPPGMGPPPGFMTAGPPPGFPGVATAAANHPSRFPAEASQGVRSGFMEMYGDMGGRGLGLRGGPAGNGGGPMPGYR